MLLVSITVPACQCSDKPDIGPVEDSTTAVVTTDRADRA